MPADAPISDRTDSEPEVNKDHWDMAGSMNSLRACFPGAVDPDDDGYHWYPVLDSNG
jgi:hypothetical protein